MKSNGRREAREFRATGEEEAQKIRADAEKTRTVIIAEAQRQAQEVRGSGDSEAIRIYAESFGRDPEFFSFYRSMQAYREAMGEQTGTSMVISPNSSFFRFFKDKAGTGAQITGAKPDPAGKARCINQPGFGLLPGTHADDQKLPYFWRNPVTKLVSLERLTGLQDRPKRMSIHLSPNEEM